MVFDDRLVPSQNQCASLIEQLLSLLWDRWHCCQPLFREKSSFPHSSNSPTSTLSTGFLSPTPSLRSSANLVPVEPSRESSAVLPVKVFSLTDHLRTDPLWTTSFGITQGPGERTPGDTDEDANHFPPETYRLSSRLLFSSLLPAPFRLIPRLPTFIPRLFLSQFITSHPYPAVHVFGSLKLALLSLQVQTITENCETRLQNPDLRGSIGTHISPHVQIRRSIMTE